MDFTESFEKGLDFADDSFESREEARNGSRESHAADMLSDNKLSKLIRPIITSVLLAIHLLDSSLAKFGIEVDAELSQQNTWMLGAAISWYFGSKAFERIAEKKAITEIKVKKEMAKAAIEKEKILLKQEIKDVKQERRHNKFPFLRRKKP